MNRQIWKFALPAGGNGPVSMPVGAKVLTAQFQNGVLCIWAEVDPECGPLNREFKVIGTGWPYDPVKLTYITTFQQPPFVWHLFEVKP